MSDVFICYHYSAVEIVGRIAAALETNGISCWYADRNIYEGNYVGQITRAIRECKVFLLILNQDASSSQYVQNEIALGFRRMMNHEKMTLLPFCVDKCGKESNNNLAYYLNAIQIMDGAPPDKEHIQKLVERVSRLAGPEKPYRVPEQAASRPAENL